MARCTPVSAMRASVSARYGAQFRMPTKTGSGGPSVASAVSSLAACRRVISFSGERPPIIS